MSPFLSPNTHLTYLKEYILYVANNVKAVAIKSINDHYVYTVANIGIIWRLHPYGCLFLKCYTNINEPILLKNNCMWCTYCVYLCRFSPCPQSEPLFQFNKAYIISICVTRRIVFTNNSIVSPITVSSVQ